MAWCRLVIVVHTNVEYALAGRQDKHHARWAGWVPRKR